jgi:hypothetical protein
MQNAGVAKRLSEIFVLCVCVWEFSGFTFPQFHLLYADKKYDKFITQLSITLWKHANIGSTDLLLKREALPSGFF